MNRTSFLLSLLLCVALLNKQAYVSILDNYEHVWWRCLPSWHRESPSRIRPCVARRWCCSFHNPALSLQAGDDPLEKGLANEADKALYARLLSSLKLRAEEEKTTGTWFVPSDRVRPVLAITVARLHNKQQASNCPQQAVVTRGGVGAPRVPATAFVHLTRAQGLAGLQYKPLDR